MKRNYYILSAILSGIALLSGILTSGISLVGRVGVNTFYKEYKFFKVWWQSALVCAVAFLVVGLLLYFIDKKFNGIKRICILLVFLLIFIGGLFFTYLDFRNDLAHRWLGERFHIGIYLYWIGFIIIDLFFVVIPKRLNLASLTNTEAD